MNAHVEAEPKAPGFIRGVINHQSLTEPTRHKGEDGQSVREQSWREAEWGPTLTP